MEGFHWFGHNRPEHSLSQQAWRGSGGVGFLVADKLLLKHKVAVIDTSVDGIMWLKLSLKNEDDQGLLLCVCYLPPEGSSTGNHAQEFYDALLSQLYMYYDGNPVIICGDFNGRIGDKQDCPDDASIRPRVPVDKISKAYGDIFLDFLNDSNTCIMNGRFDPGRDNYTCISTRGKSVVDYIIAPKLQLQNVHDLSVTTVTDAIERYDLTMDANTKIPDHSMVNCTVSMSQFYVIRESDCRQRTTTANNGRPRIIEPVHRRYRVNILPTGLFENERSRRILSDMIDRLHTAAINQDQIDNTYQEFIDHIHSEMDCNLEYKDYTPGMQKRKKRSKPYWDDDLAAM